LQQASPNKRKLYSAAKLKWKRWLKNKERKDWLWCCVGRTHKKEAAVEGGFSYLKRATVIYLALLMKNSSNSEKAVEVRPERRISSAPRGRNLTRRLSHFYSLGKQKDFALTQVGANFLLRHSSAAFSFCMGPGT